MFLYTLLAGVPANLGGTFPICEQITETKSLVACSSDLMRPDVGVAQNSTAGVTPILVVGPIYQGAISVHFLDPQPLTAMWTSGVAIQHQHSAPVPGARAHAHPAGAYAPPAPSLACASSTAPLMSGAQLGILRLILIRN